MDDNKIEGIGPVLCERKPGEPGYRDRPQPPDRTRIRPLSSVASAEKIMSFFMDDDTNQHDAADDEVNKQDVDS